MRRFALPLSFAFLLTLTQFAHAADPFERTHWHITVTPDDDARGAGERPFEDDVTFKGGKFISDHFTAKGFAPVDYDSDTRRGPLAAFTVNAKSDTNGTLKWTGTTTGADITGDLVWTKADGSVANFSFTGEKKE
jgi:hypothetical protein